MQRENVQWQYTGGFNRGGETFGSQLSKQRNCAESEVSRPDGWGLTRPVLFNSGTHVCPRHYTRTLDVLACDRDFTYLSVSKNLLFVLFGPRVDSVMSFKRLINATLNQPCRTTTQAGGISHSHEHEDTNVRSNISQPESPSANAQCLELSLLRALTSKLQRLHANHPLHTPTPPSSLPDNAVANPEHPHTEVAPPDPSSRPCPSVQSH